MFRFLQRSSMARLALIVTAGLLVFSSLQASVLARDQRVKAQTLLRGDIVFIIDETESMGPAIDNVKAGVDDMVNQLQQEGIDFQLGVVGFGKNDGHPGITFDGQPHIYTPLTSNVPVFQLALNQLMDDPGGVEPGFSAVVLAMSNAMGFRPGSGRCAILISDEDADILPNSPQTRADALAALQGRNAVFMGIVRPTWGTTQDDYGPNAGSLAQATGGLIFDISAFLSNSESVLAALIGACTKEVGVRDPPPPATDLAPGLYFTDINIHNPNDKIVKFRKMISLDGFEAEHHGLQTSPVDVILGPDEALNANCTDISSLLSLPLKSAQSKEESGSSDRNSGVSAQQRARVGTGNGQGFQYIIKFACGHVGGSTAPFLAGFVVLYSRVKLDVAATYTACPADCNTTGGITTIQVDELIPASSVPPPAVFVKGLAVSSAGLILSVTPFSPFAYDGARLMIYDLKGRLLYDSGFVVGTSLSWRPLLVGRPMANGVYLYVVAVRDVLGQESFQRGKFAWTR